MSWRWYLHEISSSNYAQHWLKIWMSVCVNSYFESSTKMEQTVTKCMHVCVCVRVCVCNVHWTFRSFLHLPQVSWTHVLISNSWQAWLGIVDQNWLKLALAKLALGQPISLKVVGMPIPVIITVRSKFPFICMKYLSNPANSTGNLIP